MVKKKIKNSFPEKNIKHHKVKTFTPSKIEFYKENKIVSWSKRKKVISRNAITNKIGQLMIRFEFIRKNRINVKEWGFSTKRNLTEEKEYIIAKHECLISALDRLKLYQYEDFIILEERFIYLYEIEEPIYNVLR